MGAEFVSVYDWIDPQTLDSEGVLSNRSECSDADVSDGALAIVPPEPAFRLYDPIR